MTNYAYDAANRLTKVTYPDSTTTLYTYDYRGNHLTEIDQVGHQTCYGYDVAGQLSNMTRACGTSLAATTGYGYDNDGRKTSETDANSHTTNYIYDKAGRLIQVTDALGTNTTTYSYDNAGQQTSVTDANHYTTQSSYDIRGRLTLTTYNDTTTTQQQYDLAGRVTLRTDQAGKQTSYAYSAVGQLLAVTDALHHSTGYGYDAGGNLLTITDANGHVTSFQYDALNRQTRKTWPQLDANTPASFEVFGYDVLSNQTSHQLADLNVNTATFDSLNRVATMHYFDGQNVTYGYTLNGQRQTVNDSRGVTTYNYDALDRVTSIIQPGGQSVSYGYDSVGNRASMNTSAGTTTYNYDNDNRLQSVGDGVNPLATYFYDGVGNRTNLALANGITTDYRYDTLNRLTGIVSHKGPQVPVASYAYTLGAAGNRTSVTEQDGSVTHWAYDDIYRLLNETRVSGTSGSLGTPTPTLPPAATFVPVTRTPGATPTSSLPSLTPTPTGGLPNTSSWNKSYTYDPVGNRLTQTANGITTNYTYNALDQLTQAASSAQLSQYTYNGRGDLAFSSLQPTGSASAISTYAWDARDRMISASVTGAGSSSFAYDDGGHRIQTTFSGQVTNYLWDELSAYSDVTLETDSTGAALASYVLGNGELISQKRSGATSYYLHDGQNSVRTLTDASGGVLNRYVYDAFGATQNASGTTQNAYQYTGQQLDSATGLYDLRARYYTSESGRFMSQDILYTRQPFSLNRYSYSRNSPIDKFDPTGNSDVEYRFANFASNANSNPVLRIGSGFVIGAIFSTFGYIANIVVHAMLDVVSEQKYDNNLLQPGKWLQYVQDDILQRVAANQLGIGLTMLLGGVTGAYYALPPSILAAKSLLSIAIRQLSALPQGFFEAIVPALIGAAQVLGVFGNPQLITGAIGMLSAISFGVLNSTSAGVLTVVASGITNIASLLSLPADPFSVKNALFSFAGGYVAAQTFDILTGGFNCQNQIC